MNLNENSINVETSYSDGEDDKIEKHLHKVLAPFQLFNFLTFNSWHHIIEKRITTKDNISIFLTLFGTVILICVKGYEFYVLSFRNKLCWYRSVANFAMFFDIFFYTFGYIFNAATVINSREKRACFIIKLNKIYKALSVKNKYKFYSIIGMIIYLISYFGGENRANIYNKKYFMKNAEKYVNYCSLFLLTTFDFNIIFAICIMKLLKVLMETWMSKIKECKEADVDLYDHYVSVMDLYKTYNDLLQNMILFHNFDFIIHQLLYMGIFVEIFSYNNIPVEMFTVVFILLLITKTVNGCVIEALLVYQCERFYAAHDNAMKECDVLLNHTDSDHVKKICKNIRRVARNEYNKITICKLYEMDAQYLQSVAMLITNYLLVIMQFENLKFPSWERFNATINSPNFTVFDNELK